MVLLLVAGTAVGAWMAVQKVFVDRWERQERANYAARKREADASGHRDPAGSGPAERARA